MSILPTLDAHAHLDPEKPSAELADSGAVLAMTFSIQRAIVAIERHDAMIAWGVGCHPRFVQAQESFDIEQFSELAARTAIIGEVGLDSGSRVESKTQLRVFRKILEFVSQNPRLVSIHSYGSTGAVLKELKRSPISVPVLHWWTGSVAETQEATELGCYFSIHSQVARQSKFHNWVPLDRVLVESDHGLKDPPAGLPPRIEWTEHLVAQQYQIGVAVLRQIVWRNLARIFQAVHNLEYLPAGLIQSGP